MDEKEKNKSKKKVIIKSLLFSLIALFILAIGSVTVGASMVADIDYNKKLQGWSQTSYAYFRKEKPNTTPEKIGEMVSPEDRKLIQKTDEVSPGLIHAFLAAEDHTFYDHPGVNATSLIRATLQQITGANVRTGGSTITQQLVKNKVLEDSAKTYKRKALEIVHSLRLEKKYSKDDILLAYINSVYFGKGVHQRHMYGVASAARGIFNKDAKELSLAQAAYIAGMVQRPNAYVPFGPHAKENLQRGLQRMKLILSQMQKYGYITSEQYNQAISFDISRSLAKKADFNNVYEQYPFIISAVEREAIRALEKAGVPFHSFSSREEALKYYRQQIREGGLRIYTTIDRDLYNRMNNSVNKLHFPKKRIRGMWCQEQAGAVLIENQTGNILSFYAGTNFKENEKDHAFEAKNQPGSAIKPLLAYGPALNEGLISSHSIIYDEPLRKAHTNQYYVNANGRYSGAQTVAHALKWSLNIPAVKVFRELGISRGFNYLRQMNMPPHKWDGEASVLGGMTEGYTVEQMTGAFAMIANHGVYHVPHLIEKITDANGKVLYQYKQKNSSHRVFKESTTNELTSMLQGVVRGGTARALGSQINHPLLAGKTGTTSNQRDLWFIGYTPSISLGVWTGYDYKTAGNPKLAQAVWIRLFKAAAKTRPDLIYRNGADLQSDTDHLQKHKYRSSKNQRFRHSRHSSHTHPSREINAGTPSTHIHPN